MYDVLIIGAGPAGISASLYVKRSNLEVIVLYNSESSLEKTYKIDNYYGFPGGIEGRELYQNGIKQAEKIGVKIQKAQVLGIESLGSYYKVKTVKGDFETKSVILSTGNKKIKPDIPGIIEYEGKGISYCAICDAFFYRNKNVAVIGNGEFAINEANELANVANKVYILTNGLETIDCEYDVNTKKISKITGDAKVNKIIFEDDSYTEIDGVFIAIGEAGAGDFAKTLGIIQDGDKIKVNNNMETNVKGVFACGDVTGGLLQISKSVYEGAIAGLTAANYIRGLKGGE